MLTETVAADYNGVPLFTALNMIWSDIFSVIAFTERRADYDHPPWRIDFVAGYLHQNIDSWLFGQPNAIHSR